MKEAYEYEIIETAYEKNWKLRRFAELSPEAAERAMRMDRAVTRQIRNAKQINPLNDPYLYYENGMMAPITIEERDRLYPRAEKKLETIIDDFGQTISFKAEWPEYCHIAHLDNGQFQAVVENESLGDHETIEGAQEEIEKWLRNQK